MSCQVNRLDENNNNNNDITNNNNTNNLNNNRNNINVTPSKKINPLKNNFIIVQTSNSLSKNSPFSRTRSPLKNIINNTNLIKKIPENKLNNNNNNISNYNNYNNSNIKSKKNTKAHLLLSKLNLSNLGTVEENINEECENTNKTSTTTTTTTTPLRESKGNVSTIQKLLHEKDIKKLPFKVNNFFGKKRITHPKKSPSLTITRNKSKVGNNIINNSLVSSNNNTNNNSYTNNNNNINNNTLKNNKLYNHQNYNTENLEINNIANPYFSHIPLSINQNINQKTFNFDTVTITSEYNSGNLLNAEKISEDTYNLYMSQDCNGVELNHQISCYKVWFYFGVKSKIPQIITLRIVNMNNYVKIFHSGNKICYRILEENQTPNDYENSYKLNEENLWKRFNENFSYKVNENNNLELYLTYEFPQNKYVLFSYCFPFSYTKIQKFLDFYDNQINTITKDTTNIYFHNEILTYSKEKRFLNLLTITSKDNIIKNQYETILAGLFPIRNRCYKSLHDKPIVVISARVHPGETPGQFMMNGLIKLLCDENNNYAKILRRTFVFKIIPMINVDGVSKGHLRLDSQGLNLNRSYLNPESKTEPEIYAIKKLFMFYVNSFKVRYYFDLHADMKIHGAYVFGNAIDNFESHVENVLFGYIFKLNCNHLNWKKCVFSEKGMNTKFKYDKNTKEATSRVHFYKKTGLIHTYTLESSYFKGYFDGQNEVQDSELYTISDFEKTGKDCLISILYYEELAINDKISNSIYVDIPGCREYIAQNILNNEERFNFNFGLKNVVKEINQIKSWKSINEINIKKIVKTNRNLSQKLTPLPKIESDRLPLINKNKKNEEDKKDVIEKHKKVILFQNRGKTISPIENKKIKIKSEKKKN